MDKKTRIHELVQLLNQAAKTYYSGQDEVMSNYEYDRLYEELVALENETGIRMSNSPTNQVGYEVLSELPKETHESQMLSLDKTKSIDTLAEFAGSRACLLSWKLDGLTVVLTYSQGQLQKAVTRGNGTIGEVITPNARTFQNLPLSIPYQGDLVLRGEAIITYSDFEQINALIEKDEDKYKNPRNLCSGSVRQLNSEITAQRRVRLFAFALIKAEGIDFHNSRAEQLLWLETQGFQVVERSVVTQDNMAETVADFSDKIKTNDFPSDGLVLLYDDISYGDSLGATSKFPRNAIAFKWADETMETTLLDMEWSASRTGLINPVAIFEPVELEGTTVSRASVHNVSIVQELRLGLGDRITVYKANMIIPQIGENLTQSNTLEIPEHCPACQGLTEIIQSAGAKSLYCMNPDCQAKHIKSFELFVSRNAMNIDGISEQTLEKFIDRGFIQNYTDLYHLEKHREELIQMEGFGEKSYQNIIASVEASRSTNLAKVLYALGIAGIGLANAKLICSQFDYQVERIVDITETELLEVAGIGEVLAQAFTAYFADAQKKQNFYELIQELNLEKVEHKSDSTIAGKVFVITGALEKFDNRDALKEYIESLGAKTTGSVSAKTDYLINNDVTSNSSKNKKAKELGIPILSEEDFMALLHQ